MPMPDPTGDTGEDHFFNARRLLAILTLLVVFLLAIAAWLAYSLTLSKRENEKPAAQIPIEASSSAQLSRASN